MIRSLASLLSRRRWRRRAATLVIVAMFMVILLGMVAFALDVGYIVLVRTQLQTAADSAAVAAAAVMAVDQDEAVATAKQFSNQHFAADLPIDLQDDDVEFGTWDSNTRTFSPSTETGNAIRVTCRRHATSPDGECPLFFGRIFGRQTFEMTASAVAMANPRDICFVVDLSGSMNDDTEPCWATSAINSQFAGEGYPTVGNDLMATLFQDFGYGAFPGTVQHVGQPLGVAQDANAYANLTKNSGPLTPNTIATTYRITSSDNEATRKTKAYKWMIDKQIAVIMPAAQPAPNSATNYAYWEKYLDYLLESVTIRTGTGTPPTNRGALPPSQDEDRITGFNNPNRQTFPSAGTPNAYRNKIGYRTYVQFMLDHGRDLKPTGNIFTPLSTESSFCPFHSESTAGGTFDFPPREQPTHASRRAIIAAMDVVERQNDTISDPAQRDWVSVVTYDLLTNGGPKLQQTLTSDYRSAMRSVTEIQAVGDKASSTATESGLILAKQHIAPRDQGGQGRKMSNKVVVLLTDGVPNLYSSSNSSINQFMGANPSGEYYGGGSYAYDASLMQAMQMQTKHWRMFPVGLGLGTDYDFMDRMARLGRSANSDGEAPRGSGNPAEYEQRLIDIFEAIITNPQVRLVQ